MYDDREVSMKLSHVQQRKNEDIIISVTESIRTTLLLTTYLK